MSHFDYVIVGGGPAGAAAALAIREQDKEGSILLLGAEREPPYQRPPLSKGLWLGQQEEGDLPIKSVADWAALQVTLALGDPVLAVQRGRRRVRTAAGRDYDYGKLLLAMGGTPRILATPETLRDRVLTLRTLEDYRRLRARAAQGGKVLVLGGGFLGAELAVALSRQTGLQVQYCVAGSGPLSHVLPPALVQMISDRYQSAGVLLSTEQRFAELTMGPAGPVARCASGEEMACDWVAYGIGLQINTALAEAAGLQLAGGGVAVDDRLRSSDPQIWIAGDMATFPDPVWGQPLRLEHWDNAEATGRHAGLVMAGLDQPYTHQGMFFSDIYEFGFEAVGECWSSMATFIDLSREGDQGVVYFLRDNQVHGVLLWNVWGQADAARALIAGREVVGSEELRGRLGVF
ncbi:NAD(P)/FAD-dependent oxidoreductase [Acidithiobacillus sulfuriphilus]|uniref:Pyridine nucleotide-disulfide oxidoreductase n=2 Tax=Acidithiobacillus sulfuriphilus TaxID=1867749 RepID=A0A3M8R9U3_9PROT|nr:FAD-dependent oxidoreductase [Acidithiobacillus sulfuriphilus]RNF65353.1 pyridine nucleotide-disulfide oxidoreductase [Acidithiobacillus sulfuriphilus]